MAGRCHTCFESNGELESICRKCGATLCVNEDVRRKLKKNDSHPDAPERKSAALDHAITPIPEESKGDTVTLEAMREMMGVLLDQKLQPMSAALTSVNADLKQFQDTVSTQFKSFQLRIDETIARVTALEERPAASGIDDAFEKRLQDIEAMITGMKFSKREGVVAVVGNLECFSTEKAASDFISKKLKEANTAAPSHSFVKGSFKGMLWIRFTSNADMMKAVDLLSGLQANAGDKALWANEDLPIEKRVPRAFLFGCKRLLGQWGYKKSLIKVDTDTYELSINNKRCISALVENNQLKITYHGDFTNWSEFKDNSDVGALKSKASGSLEKAGQGLKGVGKGAQ